MGQKGSRTEFTWIYTDQPHASRRQQILKKYPQMKELFGPDPWMALWVVLIVATQMYLSTMVTQFSWPMLLVLAYTVGALLNHMLMIAIHDISHNLVFGVRYPNANRLVGALANLTLVLPFSVGLKEYHNDHHKLQGFTILDPTVPSYWETRLFDTTLGKIVWLFFHSIFYFMRPLYKAPKKNSNIVKLHNAVQLAFNIFIAYHFGVKAIVYMALCSFMMMGIHPLAGHYIGEHYLITEDQETNSYYGPFNYISFNVGYHNEHHDFPYIAARNLPKVKALAPEFYDMPHHNSYLFVVYDFLTNPDVGLRARIVRDKFYSAVAPLGDGVD